MPSPPSFDYYISDGSHPIDKYDVRWKTPLPLYRKLKTVSNSRLGVVFSYGDYFTAVKSYLSENQFKAVVLAVRDRYQLNVVSDDIKKISIFLKKHGEFYHPSRIQVDVGCRHLSFVLNVAVSETGLSFIQKEYDALQYLAASFPYAFIPRAFDLGEIKIGSRHLIKMFLGEWLDGFSEFHLSKNPENGRVGIIVWDDVKGRYYLNKPQALQLYEQSAEILTCYYNPFTYHQVFPWHHAAGDFVLNVDADNVRVRLITVRNYAPMIENVEKDLGEILDGLLIFFLNLSIRMRLDRLDGVGELEWADSLAVEGTVTGFFKGLKRRLEAGVMPEELIDGFKAYLSSFKPPDLLDWANSIVDGFHPDTPELDLIRMNLNNHIKFLHEQIANFLHLC